MQRLTRATGMLDSHEGEPHTSSTIRLALFPMLAKIVRGLPFVLNLAAVMVPGFAQVPVAAAAESIGPGLAPVGVKASSSQASDPTGLIDGRGLEEAKPGSGVFVHGNSKYAEQGSIWNADYSDKKPWLLFDLGRAASLTGVQIWNGNEKGYESRSVRSLAVLTSNDGKAFAKAGEFELQPATGGEEEPGQELKFAQPVTARFVRLEVLSNHNPNEPAALSEVRFLSPDAKPSPPRDLKPKYAAPAHAKRPLGEPVADAENIVFPPDAGVIDVTKPP